MTVAGRPTRPGEQERSTKRILLTVFFFFFSAEEQPLELPEQSKLRPEDTQRERLVRHFPNYHQKKKKIFFVAIHGYTVRPVYYSNKVPTMSLSIKKKKRELLFPAHISHFTVPERLQKCSSFPFFFISLPKSFFNFCSRYLLRNRMCGQAKLPGPEVQLQKIYSRHPLDFS